MKTKKGGWFWQDNMNVNVQSNSNGTTMNRTIQINKKLFIEDLFKKSIGEFSLQPGNYELEDNNGYKYFIVYTNPANIVCNKEFGFYANLNDYEGKTLFLNKVSISQPQQYISTINYTFHRHGFSCNNLNKAFGSKGIYKLNDVEDPSLTIYGILDILLNRDKLVAPKPAYNGFVFVSSLIRTWQTAILLHFSSDARVNKYIIVSPFIKEKQNDKNPTGNRPIIFDDQWSQMSLFFSLLKQIYLYISNNDHILGKKIKNIMESNIYIIDPIRSRVERVSSNMYTESKYPQDKTDYPFNKEYIEMNINDFLSNNKIPRIRVNISHDELSEKADEYFNDTQYVANKRAALNRLSPKYTIETLTTYYKEESLQNFDKWVKDIYTAFNMSDADVDLFVDPRVLEDPVSGMVKSDKPDIDRKINSEVAFAVSHSGTMQAILNYYVTPKTMNDNEKVFDTNVWSFNYHLTTFKLNMGLRKPDPTGMSKYNEPACNPTSSRVEKKDYVTAITDKRAQAQLQQAKADIEWRKDPLQGFMGGKTFKRKKNNRRTKYVKRKRQISIKKNGRTK